MNFCKILRIDYELLSKNDPNKTSDIFITGPPLTYQMLIILDLVNRPTSNQFQVFPLTNSIQIQPNSGALLNNIERSLSSGLEA